MPGIQGFEPELPGTRGWRLNAIQRALIENRESRLILSDQARQALLEMGLGRLELPTSRLSGPHQTGQIPASCRTFTGRTHDLPFLRQNMPESAGIYRPNDRPKPPLDRSRVRDSKTQANQSPMKPGWFTCSGLDSSVLGFRSFRRRRREGVRHGLPARYRRLPNPA